MNREVFITKDGSASIFAEKFGESYHSHFGAVAESFFVYIESGLKYTSLSPVEILEIGFGTGLNALLTWNETLKSERKTSYYSIEKYPLRKEEWKSLNYQNLGLIDKACKFEDLHLSRWNEWHDLDEYFSLFKSQSDLLKFSTTLQFDLIYFDAFSPEVQPELWTDEIFLKLYQCLKPGGMLLTYSVKGIVKRALKSVGFRIELIPGPEGKRAILRASK